MIWRAIKLATIVLAAVVPGALNAQVTPSAEKRIALVIGNAAYQTGALKTPANDAGLIAQTLQAAGFDVVGARDLDQDSLRRAFRDFIEKARVSGPNTVAAIYLSGYGLQLEGENYFVPIDARIARDSDVATESVRLSDYTRSLAALKLKTSIVILDIARGHPFAKSGAPLASGLALMEPEGGMLIAINAAPGTAVREGTDSYGPYAQALSEMIREGGLSLDDVFNRTRLRVNEVTKGGQVPWHASKVQQIFVFFERGPDAPAPAVTVEQTQSIRSRPIRDFSAQEAYIAALERDTMQGYLDFLVAYPDDPMALRVRAIVAARREALTWRRTRSIDTPDAYWSYLRRYPNGPHAADARRRLAYLAAAFEPPPSFIVVDYDVPPPPPQEFVYFEQPVIYFDDPIYAFASPPPPPVYFLTPLPFDYVVLPPPPPPIALFVLPIPIYRPVPLWVRAPVYVAPPPQNNVIFNNIHNTVVINNTTNVVTITNPSGQSTTVSPSIQRSAPGVRQPPTTAPTATALVGPALPPSVAQRAISLQRQVPQAPGKQPLVPGQSPSPQIQSTQPRSTPQQSLIGKPLPGTQGGRPLPPTTRTPASSQSGQSPTLQPGQKPASLTQPQTGAAPSLKELPKSSTTTPNIPSTTIQRSTAPTARTTPGIPPSGPRTPSQQTATQPLPPPTGTRQSSPSAVINRAPPPSQQINRQPPPPPTTINRSQPPTIASRPPSPPPVVNRTSPSPPVVNRPSPPVVVNRPPSPPPVVSRPPPPPPAVVNRPPPAPAVVNRPPPPPPVAQRPAASCPAGTRSVNGQCVK